MSPPLQVADEIAQAAIEEIERLKDLSTISISRTSLRELAEAYLYVRKTGD